METQSSPSSKQELAQLLLAMNAPSRSNIAGYSKAQRKLTPGRQSYARTAAPRSFDLPFEIPTEFDENLLSTKILLFLTVAIGGSTGYFTTDFLFKEFALMELEDDDDELVGEPCAECKGEKVVMCQVCKGTGAMSQVEIQLKKFGGTKEEGESAPVISETIKIETWEGEEQVVKVGGVMAEFPIIEFDNPCRVCKGKGVLVCRVCEGSGIQPGYLDKLSPEDFMD
jgi:hypothetical protein